MILTSCEIEEEGKCHLYCYRSDGNIYVVSGDYEIEVSEKECSNICKEENSNTKGVCDCTFCLDNDCKEVN